MRPGQYRAIVLLLLILGIEVLTNPAVKSVVGGFLSFNQSIQNKINQGG